MNAKTIGAILAVAVVIAALWLRRSEPPASSVTEPVDGISQDAGQAPLGQAESGASRGARVAPGDRVAQQVEQLSAQHQVNFRKWHTKEAPDSPGSSAHGAGTQPHAGGAKAVAAPADADGDDDREASDAAEFDSLKRQVLSDPDPEQRIDALTSLYPYDDEVVLPVLQQALADRDTEVRLTALEKIAALDEPPINLLALALKDSDPEMRERAVIALSYIQDDRAAALIRDAHNDSNEDVRNAAQLYGDIEDIELGDE